MASTTFVDGNPLTAAQMNTLGDTVDGSATTATAAGTSTQTVASKYQQFYTGSSTQSHVMPVTTTLVVGWKQRVVNNSSGIVTVKTSDGTTIYAVPAGGDVLFTCVLASGTTAASWDYKNHITTSSAGMTSIATGTLSGATPSISGISGGYKHLELWVTDPYGSGANIINIRFNSDSGANYSRNLANSAQVPTVSGTSAATSIATYNGIITSANANGYFLLRLPFYSSTDSGKPVQFQWNRDSGGANELIWANYNSASAISSIQFFLDGGSTFTGGAYTLYGVN